MTGGDLLQLCREMKALSLAEAGRRIGISKAHLWQLEQGKCLPTFAHAIALCDFYGITFDRLAACVRPVAAGPRNVEGFPPKGWH